MLQDKASEALDIFDELVEIEIGIIIPYVKPLVEFCMQVMVIIKGRRTVWQYYLKVETHLNLVNTCSKLKIETQ